MSYRDDHEAAVQRVDALERELALVRGEAGALEVPELVREIEQGAQDRATATEIKFTVGLLAIIGSLAIGMLSGSVAFVVVTGVVMWVWGLTWIVLRPGYARDSWQPVLDAVRDDPARISSVSLWKRGISDTVTISTGADELRLTSGNGTALVAKLGRRCPQARFDDA